MATSVCMITCGCIIFLTYSNVMYYRIVRCKCISKKAVIYVFLYYHGMDIYLFKCNLSVDLFVCNTNVSKELFSSCYCVRVGVWV